MENKIKVEVDVKGSIDKVWKVWNDPKHIINWNFAHPDWHTPKVSNDFRVGGTIYTRMEAKDGSIGFDWINTYDEIKEHQLIKYHMEDGRECAVIFEVNNDHVKVIQEFDPETENSVEKQQEGWQNIMNNFKIYLASLRGETNKL